MKASAAVGSGSAGGGVGVFGEFHSHSAQQTLALGKELGCALTPGQVVLLFGRLGAGKTVFAKGIASGLGIAERDVTSPSFVLLNVYTGKTRLLHLDLYRIEDAGQAEQAGLLDLFEADAIVVVEWPERIVEILAEMARIEVHIEVVGPERRRIVVQRVAEGDTRIASN